MIRIQVDHGKHLAADRLVANPIDKVVAPLQRLLNQRQAAQEGACALAIHAQEYGVHRRTLSTAMQSLMHSGLGSQIGPFAWRGRRRVSCVITIRPLATSRSAAARAGSSSWLPCLALVRIRKGTRWLGRADRLACTAHFRHV
jgi:hypothetical protein